LQLPKKKPSARLKPGPTKKKWEKTKGPHCPKGSWVGAGHTGLVTDNST